MRTKKIIWLLALCTVFSGGAVYGLFLLSEEIVHYHNTFIRRFPQHTAQEQKALELHYNSYYFAGAENGKIYLGNRTAPLLVTVVDTSLTGKATHKINLLQRDLPFQSPQVRVAGGDFFVFEGTVPYIFRGRTHDWSASLSLTRGRYFSAVAPMGQGRVAVRFMRPGKGENLLGAITFTDRPLVVYGDSLLQKQFDGIFDTDGMLHYDAKEDRAVYVYFYRNQFIVARPDMKLGYRGKTIDTVSRAQLRLARVGKGTMRTLAEPPLMVNKLSAVHQGLLFVNSTLPGQYESDYLWKSASIIDVYSLADGAYQSSFPVYHRQHKRMGSMLVYGDHLFALIGTELVSYRLSGRIVTKR
jgi:hypothetical protein